MTKSWDSGVPSQTKPQASSARRPTHDEVMGFRRSVANEAAGFVS